jgi:hypothetical protein
MLALKEDAQIWDGKPYSPFYELTDTELHHTVAEVQGSTFSIGISTICQASRSKSAHPHSQHKGK